MKKTYTQMLAEIEALKREAEEVRRKEVEGVIERIRAAIAFYGLTEEDLGFKKRDKEKDKVAATPSPVPAKKKKRKSRYTERPLAGVRR